MHTGLQPIDAFPVPWNHRLPGWLGEGSFQILTEVPRFDTIPFLGIVSSHQSKFGYAHHDWQAALQAALHLAQQQGWVVLIATDTPYYQAIEHACIRMQLPWMSLAALVQHVPTEDAVHSKKPSCLGSIQVVFPATDEPPRPQSLPDRSIMLLSERVFALDVRKGGSMESLLSQRLEQTEIAIASTYVAIHSHTPNPTTRLMPQLQLMEKGAVGWLASNAPMAPSDGIEEITQFRARSLGTSQLIFRLPSLHRSKRNYLVHTTRARCGPWPDQSLSQFHDEIMNQPWTHKPSVLETLIRILDQQRLIATSDLRRSKKETICFSERPVAQLPTLRHFQSHLGRWDWEPYGIMIDREWLIEQGAKKVEYITPEEAKHRDANQLLYCQVVKSRGGKNDWSSEQEWRLAGDLRLHHVPYEKCFIIVPDDLEAKKIQRLSRWPILSLQDLANT